MTTEDRLSWTKPEVSLRRAHFLLTEKMKLRAERTLADAAEVMTTLNKKG